MRVIIKASPTLDNWSRIDAAIAASAFELTEIVSDDIRMASHYAVRDRIPMMYYPPGHEENMREFGEALIAVHDSNDEELGGFIEWMRSDNKPVYVANYEPPPSLSKEPMYKPVAIFGNYDNTPVKEVLEFGDADILEYQEALTKKRLKQNKFGL